MPGVFITPVERAILRKMDSIHAAAEARTAPGLARDLGIWDYTGTELARLAELNRLREEVAPT